MTDESNIEVLQEPIEADYVQWAIEHPECDSIIEHIGQGATMRVFAYAITKAANRALRDYRNKYLSDKRILVGMTKDGISSIV